MTGCHAARLRCTICGNPDWHRRGGGEECTHCGLTVEGPATLETVRAAIAERLAQGVATAPPRAGWSLAPHAWRNAAWALGHVLEDETAYPAVPVERPITLAVMTQPSELAEAAALVEACGDRFARVLVAIDTDALVALPSILTNAETIRHPLAGDFAGQRNRLQTAAGKGWVLQLDSDERPNAALLEALGWTTAAADRGGLLSLGLARRNLVDGVQAALYPDIQYRLNRACLRFAGAVHERPVVPFARTSLALAGAIEHRLSAERVRARTATYGAMSADGARPEDEARLLRPFDAIAER